MNRSTRWVPVLSSVLAAVALAAVPSATSTVAAPSLNIAAGAPDDAGEQGRRFVVGQAVDTDDVGASTVDPGDQPVGLGDEIPTRRPELSWQAPVRCPAGACEVRVADAAAYVLTPGKPAELIAIDAVTGAERWRRSPPVRASTFDVVGRLVLLHGQAETVVLDRHDGEHLSTIAAATTSATAAGLVFSDDGVTVAGWNATNGKRLWTSGPGVRLAVACRDVVVLSSHGTGRLEAVDQRTGATRWRSAQEYDLTTGTALCGSQWLYVTDGHSMSELDLVGGFRNWRTPIAGAATFEGLGAETALVFGDGQATGVNLWDGVVLWSRPGGDVGERVDGRSWLRTDGTAIFRLLPWSGDVTATTDPFANPGAPAIDDAGDLAAAEMEITASSESRLVLRRGEVIVTVGTADLGESWRLELPAVPHWSGVSSGTLLTVDDDTLDGYRVRPLLDTVRDVAISGSTP